MIIHSIVANNVLKYAKLELSNLPEKGKIAISGANESGKTAIVETISFALFGQTFSNNIEHITRTIRWGEPSCSVDMVFTGTGNNSYTISRSVDKQGMHSAELFLSGEDVPFATGPKAVQDEIIKVCGFDFEQYVDSLYLAQMEITSSASQAETIKAIAGAMPIESIKEDLVREISLEQDRINSIEQEQERIRSQIVSLDIRPERLAEIDAEKQQCNEQNRLYTDEVNTIQNTSASIREAGRHIQETGHDLTSAGQAISVEQWKEHLVSVSDSIESMRESINNLDMESELRSGGELKKYTDKLQTRLARFEPVKQKADDHRAELATLLGERGSKNEAGIIPLPRQQSRLKRRLFSQRTYRVFMKILLVTSILCTVMLGAAWVLLTRFPDSEISAALLNGLNLLPSWFDTSYLSSLQMAAISSLVFTLLVFFLSSRVNARINRGTGKLAEVSGQLQTIRSQADLLDHIKDEPLPEVIQGLAAIDNKSLKTALERFTDNDGSTFVSEQVFADHQLQMNGLLEDNASNTAALREDIATRIAKLDKLSEQQNEKTSKLSREVEDLQAGQKEANDLEKVIENMQPDLNDHQQRIQVRETALKLAAGACNNIYSHFNQVLSKFTASVIPKLTEGRYKQIQISDDLQVRAFATEKNDFADLDELSSGTQRQIMLAVRLAISKALVEAGQQGKQFIILDEPFAFFDRERIRNTIKSLPDLDKNITQFWVLTQEFESAEQFELNIKCSRENDELTLAN
jgi:exonuclease SbcC